MEKSKLFVACAEMSPGKWVVVVGMEKKNAIMYPDTARMVAGHLMGCDGVASEDSKKIATYIAQTVPQAIHVELGKQVERMAAIANASELTGN